METLTLVTIIVCSLVVVLWIFIVLVFISLISKNFKKRFDYSKELEYKYFDEYKCSKEYLDLTIKEFNVITSKNAKLRVCEIEDKKVSINKVIYFIPGFSPGVNAYTTLCMQLVKLGYKVISFDSYGCGKSEGKNIKSWYQKVIDFKYIVEFYKEAHANVDKFIIGHSQGGYTSFVCLKYFPNYFKKIINISGIESFSKVAFNYKNKLASFMFKVATTFSIGYRSCINSSKYLNRCKSIKYYIVGSEDNMASKSREKYLKKLDSLNVICIVIEGAYHNPYQPLESEEYMKKYFSIKDNKEKIDLDLATKIDDKFIKFIEDVLIEE